MRAGRRALVFGLCALLVWGCTQPTSPARTPEDYEEKAAATAASVLSATETARLVVAGVVDDDLFAATTARMLDETEAAASGAAASFERIQPPDGGEALQLRSSLADLLDRATDELASLRIEARQGRIEEPRAHLARLDRLADDLRTFTEAHQ